MLYCETLGEIKVLAQVSALRDTWELHDPLAPLLWCQRIMQLQVPGVLTNASN